MLTRFRNFLSKDSKCNALVVSIVSFNTIVFSVGVALKVFEFSETIVDSLKLCIVWGNIFLFEILLFSVKYTIYNDHNYYLFIIFKYFLEKNLDEWFSIT